MTDFLRRGPSFAVCALVFTLLGGCGGGGDSGGGDADPPDVPAPPPAFSNARIEGAWTGSARHVGSNSQRPAVLIATRGGDTLLFVQRGIDSIIVRGDACCGDVVDGTGDGWTLVNQQRTPAPVRLNITDLISGQRALTGNVTVEGERYELDLRLNTDYLAPLAFPAQPTTYAHTTASGTRSFTISPTGRLTGTDSVGCSFDSQLGIPDASRNLFVMTSLTMSNCPAMTTRNGTYSGLGYIAGLADPAAPDVLTFILTGPLVYMLALPGATAVTPSVSLIASPTTLEYGGSTMLTWSATPGSNCSASDAWTGARSAGTGSESIAALTQDSTFTLTCEANGVAQTVSTLVSVTPLPADPGTSGEQTIAGVDANMNGVRDDVERRILIEYAPGPLRTSLLRRAEITAAAIEAPDEPTARQQFTQLFRNLECLYSVDPSTAAKEAAKLTADMVNTEARARAYIDFARRAGGVVIEVSDPEQFAASCAE